MSNIDWSRMITAEMKAAAAAAVHLIEVKAVLAAKNAGAVVQIARIQDRIDTLGYGIDAGEATEEDEAEQAALMISIASWKSYKFSLGKVTKQPGWHAAPVWPTIPAIPVIVADPDARSIDAA
ncbi:phage tail protein [Pseudomonas sp. AL03]|uniref:phage tail protein n=1 Tax=Pseudomonas sp. AL03 TaxID=3042230 RepID=UPI00249A5238|nr:phage tail protein [Pseudomonas sp. AL03]MDI3274889.1 phage tail protein [Pseudomonas sp. AL03]